MYFKEFSCNKTENMQVRCVPRFIQRFPNEKENFCFYFMWNTPLGVRAIPRRGYFFPDFFSHTYEEIAAENERMLKIQRTAIKYMREYHGFEPNGDYAWRLFGSFHRSGDSPYYSFSLDYTAADSTVYIDEQSLEVIPPETLLCENWQEYIPEEKRSELRFEVVYQSAKEDQFTVQYSYLNEISSARSWGSFYIPKDKLNSRYLE